MKNKIVFECKQCGGCCKRFTGTLSATVEDIKKWEAEGREDILKYVYIFEFGVKIAGGDLWFDPETNEELTECPFLGKKKGKFICLIHDTKPTICKDYPFKGDCTVDEKRIKECPGIRKI